MSSYLIIRTNHQINSAIQVHLIRSSQVPLSITLSEKNKVLVYQQTGLNLNLNLWKTRMCSLVGTSQENAKAQFVQFCLWWSSNSSYQVSFPGANLKAQETKDARCQRVSWAYEAISKDTDSLNTFLLLKYTYQVRSTCEFLFYQRKKKKKEGG